MAAAVPGGGHELRSVAGRAAGAHGPRRYVAVGGAILVSDAGQDWRLATQPGLPLQQVIWTGEHFVAVGVGGLAMSSPDGLTWTPHDTGTSVDLTGVAAPSGGSRWIVVGEGGTILGSPARIPRQGP